MIFKGADILIPECDLQKWATVACDQHTSEKEYWDRVERIVGSSPSALHITLPEIYLNDRTEQRIAEINKTMDDYLKQGLFSEYKNSMVYTERLLSNGKLRRGLLGCIDLEAYDYAPLSSLPIRATEATVAERIPPRVKIRENAPLELPHTMLLADDPQDRLLSALEARKHEFRRLYSFDLMEEGGHIEGYLIDAAAQTAVLSVMSEFERKGFALAVGDGNHSLAAAKECYRSTRDPLSRFALSEIVNIHDDSLEFEPIYRVIKGCDPELLISDMQRYFEKRECTWSYKIDCVFGSACRSLSIPAVASLPVTVLQDFLDRYLACHDDLSIDYIHGKEETARIASSEFHIGFLFDGMSKDELFPAVSTDGALVRKTFSMGRSCDKRYYLEARRIKSV